MKQEVAARLPNWRFAYSRPGFVTFKLEEEAELAKFDPPKLTFARVTGLSLAKVGLTETASELAEQVWRLPQLTEPDSAAIAHLHVWERDRVLPGEEGFEPGPTPLSNAAHEALKQAQPAPKGDKADEPALSGRDAFVLDVVLVEPNEWWVGAHVVRSRTDRWVGGSPALELPEHAVSRAYLKMQEALRWSSLPTSPGDLWVELGCAPGGASQALMDVGMRVVGVDPAEVDPAVAADERFTHVRAKTAEAPRKAMEGAHWITADINAAPSYTLEAVESLLKHDSIRPRGVLLTLKLLSPHLASPEQVRECLARVRSWGLEDVRVRQLVHNRREYCLAALKRRSQRRWSRGTRRTKQAD